MQRLRQTLWASAVILGCATPVFALDQSTCFQPAASIDQITASLQNAGWTKADRADPKVIDHVTWMGLPQYFAGDTGGAQLEQVLDIKSMSARGILRKKDIATAKTRVLSRKTNTGPELAMVTLLQPTQNRTDIRCTFSLTLETVNDVWTAPNGFAPTQDFTRHTALAPTLDEPTAYTNLSITSLNTTNLSQRLGQEIPTEAIVETYLSVLAKEN